jgi:hypothetical protein
VLEAEAEEVAVEAERALEVGDADPDMRQAEERDHGAIVTLMAPVVLSLAVWKASDIFASG